MKKWNILLMSLAISSLFAMSILHIIPNDTFVSNDNLKPTYPINTAIITIDGNAELANNATAGNGTAGNPYIIENYVINASGLNADGILIQNTTAYFILRNCTITDAFYGYAGIKLTNVTNGIITNNTCNLNKGYGLYLTQSSNNTLSDNKAINGLDHGIYLEIDCDNNTLTHNNVSNNQNSGIYIYTNCTDNEFTHNIVKENDCGIYLREDCDNNTLAHNNLSYNNGHGIYLYRFCDNNTLTNNSASFNGQTNFASGIYIYSLCNDNTLTNNTASYNGIIFNCQGIHIYDNSRGNTLINNSANYNTEYGICVQSWCDNTTITHNTANYNEAGIRLESSVNNNTLDQNTANYNTETGFALIGTCQDNTLTNNTANNNTQYGVYLTSNCFYNTLTNNTANNNTLNGVYLWNADYSSITWNTLHFNIKGIRETSCTGNIIANNDILDRPLPYESPIQINSNADFETYKSQGNGSIGNPYIIENRRIETSYYGSDNILIQNTSAYFILRNCTLTGADTGYAGIKLSNATNGLITNNTCSDNDYGVYLTGSSNNTFTFNKLVIGNYYGIFLEDASNNNTLANNTVTQNFRTGIIVTQSIRNTLSNNTITENNDYGVWVQFYSNFTTLDHNNISDNLDYGIYLSGYSYNNTLTNNIVYYNDDYGIYLATDCDNNTLTYNSVNNNSFSGIYLDPDCDDNTLTNNSANYNGQIGTGYGISLNSADGNIISQNNISYNRNYGLRVVGNSANNLIFLNTFIGNKLAQADYSASGAGNAFDNGSLGNFYSDYPAYHPLASHNGIIWNESYQIDTLYDYYPLVSPWGLNWTPRTPQLDPILPNPTPGQINLTWSADGLITKFHVYRDTSEITSVASLSPIASVTIPNYFEVIKTNGTYFYVVVTENIVGNSTISNCENVTVEVHFPWSNQPDDEVYFQYSSPQITWRLYDDFLPGNYTVYWNGSVYETYTWANTWTNGTAINIPVNASIVGIWNYTIFYNDSLGFFGIPDTVWINITRHLPSVEIIAPINGAIYSEFESIQIITNVTDVYGLTAVQLYINSTFIDNLQYNGSLYLYNWTNLFGHGGMNVLQVRAYNIYGKVNDTESVWVNITLYIPPAEHADLYNVTTTNSTGSPQNNFTQGEQVIYEVTIRGDLGSGSYVVMAHTDDPSLNAYLTYNETVQVQAGVDTVVKFYFDIPTGATVPTGTYKVYLTVWTDWPYAGGICVDYIIETFTVN